MEEEGVEPSGLSSCPSFNSYSSQQLLSRELQQQLPLHLPNDSEEGHHYDDFEFFPLAGGDVYVPDDGLVIISHQIGPVFPVFNRDLLLENGYGLRSRGGGEGDVRSIRIPLMDLFIEEDHDLMSSEAGDELQGIPEGSYCVWTPRDSVSWCKKSNSIGSRSSRRWRFLDLLRRSNSDRKDSFVLLTPTSNGMSGDRRSRSSVAGGGGERRKGKSALEVFYTRRQVAVRGGDNRRKSYLPYRQDLVGFFANVSSLGRSFPPLAPV